MEEAGVPDPVRDLVAVGVDAGDALVVGRQQRQGLLRPLAEGDVPEGLPVAEGLVALLAVLDGRVVGLERRERAARGMRHLGDIRGDLRDLAPGEPALEGGHAVAACAHLTGNRRLVRLELIQVRADLALRTGRLEGVAAGAARGREDLRARRAGGAVLRTAAGAYEQDNCEEDPAAKETQLHRPGASVR